MHHMYVFSNQYEHLYNNNLSLLLISLKFSASSSNNRYLESILLICHNTFCQRKGYVRNITISGERYVVVGSSFSLWGRQKTEPFDTLSPSVSFGFFVVLREV